jgi:small subunit ribosomal protein S1
MSPRTEAKQATSSANSTATFEEEMLSMDEMEEMYQQSMRSFREGEVVRGRVVDISPDYVLVDIGYKSEGLIPIEEFPRPSDIKPGDEFDVFIDHPEDENGMPVLSKIKADKIKNWAHIQEIYEKDGTIEGRIVRRVKGGLKVDIGIDAFMPASQLTWRPTSDLDRYLGQTMELKIIKLTRRRRNVVVSRRKLLEEQRAGDKSALLQNIAIGKTLTGEVKNITDFGAFVDVGGIDGLLHVTDMSWGRVKHPSQVVSVGQRIDVVVLNFDPQTERISLGLKQKSENPWKTAPDRYPVGTVVRGRVVSMTDYGAFVQLEDGIEGMVHVSEMSWTRRVRHPNEVVNIDDQIDVMILSVDPQAEKIALGIKQTQPSPWRQLAEKYPVGSAVKGRVRNLTDYGAFVEIEEGIDALLHVSDMSWTRKVAHPSEMLQKNQEVEVKILTIDPEHEKISVGLKQMEIDPWQSVIDALPIGTHVDVEIAKLVSFGAFAKLKDGVEGLIHVSEISNERVSKPEEVLSVGEKVMAKVISVDAGERKIGLSIKEYQKDLDNAAKGEFSVSGGTPSVNVGDAVGDAVPKSLISAGKSLADAANEMMAAINAQQKNGDEK